MIGQGIGRRRVTGASTAARAAGHSPGAVRPAGALNRSRPARLLAALLLIALTHPPAGARPQEKGTPVSFYNYVALTPPEHAFHLSAVSDTSLWYTTNEGLFRTNGVTVEKKLAASLFARGLIEAFLVEALSDNDVWVLGHDAQTWQKTMYHFDGREWARVPFPQYDADSTDDLVLYRFRIARDSRGYYGAGVGQDGLYYEFDGQRWLLKPPFTKRSLRALEMIARDDIWAGGRDGALYHYDGKAWTDVPVKGGGFKDYILEMSFSSTDAGWAVSTNNVLRWAAGHWSAVGIPEGIVGRAVKSVAGDDAWIFTDNGTVLRYDGILWNAVAKVPMQTGYASVGFVRGDGYDRGYTLYVVTNTGVISNVWGRVPMFIDVSPSANIHLNGGEIVVADFDADGNEDLFVSADGKYADRLYANRGDGFYNEMTERLHPLNRAVAARSSVGDLDNNGYPDIAVHRGLADNLWYRNSGSWTFTENPGPVSATGPSNYSRLLPADMDNDGDLDLVMMPAVEERSGESIIIYRNDGVGRFPDSTVLSFPMRAGSSPASFFLADLDRNGMTDIVKYNIHERVQAYLNQPDGSYREAAVERGLADAASGPATYVTWAEGIDIDGNGAEDVFLVSRRGVGVFMMNNGWGYFTAGDSVVFDPAGENPVGAFSDIDCDGDDDLFLDDRFYENRGGGFREYRYLGFRGNGLAHFTDFDRDGDEDLVFGTVRAERGISVFENEVNPGNVLSVTLRGIRSNSGGLGSTVRLWKTGDGAGRTLARFAELRSPRPLRFALDSASTYDLEVRFPGGETVTRTGVRPGFIAVDEYGGPVALFWDFVCSFGRSLRMADLSKEGWKLLLVALLVAGGMFLATLKLGTSARANIVFGAIVVAAYVLAVHGTVRGGPIVSTIFPVGGALLAAGGWIGARNRIETERRAKRISHYLLGEQLGEGGMGKVYSATDSFTGQRVALKVLSPELLNDPENRKRLMAEGHLLSTLKHRNIVRVYEVGEHLGRGFIAMEYLPGGTVQAYFAKNAPLPPAAAKGLSLEICAGLLEIHRRGVIHRDLKSGNIMFGADGGVRIMDFGLSKSPLVTTMTTLGTILGTLGYVSPEQVTNISVDHRADIFSFGVLLYEMLTGKLPFNGENEMAVIHAIFNVEPPPPSSINPSVPARLDAVVRRCLRKNPDERYASAEELRFDLDGDYW